MSPTSDRPSAHRRYYLSTFIGSGTSTDRFRARISLYGPSGWVDLRPDGTRQDGWCVAYLDAVDHTDAEADSNLIPLHSDPYVPIEGHVLQSVKRDLGVEFRSSTLADVLAEILLMQLLPGRGLRPGADGIYRINLGGLLRMFTEDEAIQFVG